MLIDVACVVALFVVIFLCVRLLFIGSVTPLCRTCQFVLLFVYDYVIVLTVHFIYSVV